MDAAKGSRRVGALQRRGGESMRAAGAIDLHSMQG
jgi:hypothetical protein